MSEPTLRHKRFVYVKYYLLQSLYYAKSVPSLQSRREIKRERQAQKKAHLSKWFDLPRGDLTQENKEDLEIISKRRVLGLDLHTRKSDGRRTHFQVCLFV